jgi:hypothetical protein
MVQGWWWKGWEGLFNMCPGLVVLMEGSLLVLKELSDKKYTTP